MKRRRLFLGLLLALSFAVVGLGYARLTRELLIGGTLNGKADNENLKVRFNTEQIITKATPVTTSTALNVEASAQLHLANIEVSGLTEYQDKVEVYFLIVNESAKTPSLNAEVEITDVYLDIDGTRVEDDNAAVNELQGDHFNVIAEFVDSSTDANLESAVAGTGTITDGKAYLNAPTESTAGGQVWLKVTIVLTSTITSSDFQSHTLNVKFSAHTIDQQG